MSSETFPMTLASGQSVTLDLQFEPTKAGDATGQLTITSNSSSNATTVVSLSGKGSSHKVKLNWDAPASGSGSIEGYNIYRAPGGTTSYQRLNSNPETSTSYTDTSVQSGETYAYVVKTVDSSGTESSPSNKTTVTIP